MTTGMNAGMGPELSDEISNKTGRADDPPQRVFFDTNIVVYCFDTLEPRKQTRAKDLLAHALNSKLGVVSYQVIQEFSTSQPKPNACSYRKSASWLTSIWCCSR